MSADASKTLEELEGRDWGEPPYNSHLVTECHRLRRVPLRAFTVEDLRLMIGQAFGLDYLVPIALARLTTDPFLEGDFYPGDLLKNVLTIPEQFWANHPGLRQEAAEIAATARAKLDDASVTLIVDDPDLLVPEGILVPAGVRQALQQFLDGP